MLKIMKLKALITVFVLLFATDAHACKYMFLESFAQKVADEAYFIGLVKIGKQEKDENDFLTQVSLEPFMVYKAPEDLPKMITISADGLPRTSCGTFLKPTGEFQEVVLYKKDGSIRLGNLMESDLRQLWEELRTKASYAGKK